MQQNKDQVERIVKESDNAKQFLESINSTTDNKFPKEAQKFTFFVINLETQVKGKILDIDLEGLHLADKDLTKIRFENPMRVWYYVDEALDYLKELSPEHEKIFVIDNVVTNNKDDDGKYIEIDYSNLEYDTNYVVSYDNQKYGVKKITDDKFEIYEVLEDG